MRDRSLLEHIKTQYNNLDLNYWKEHNERHQDDSVFNNEEIKLKYLIYENPNVNKLAIDIGSGVGWLSAKLSDYFDEVISIEPSEDAVKISKDLYGDKKNIYWNIGFAEDFLNILRLKTPTLFVTCSVFQHLDDNTVESILKFINDNAPTESILSFQELWGEYVNVNMHHIRTKDWWASKLSNWDLNFHGPVVMSNANKGIHGKKTGKTGIKN